MKNKRLSRVWSKRKLPEEIWPEILSRLPVKSLLRFRCVSKSWLSLIKDHDFCRLHLRNFKNNHDETHLLVVEGKKQECVVLCSDTFDFSSGTTMTLGPRHSERYMQVGYSVDGLVLLKYCSRNERFRFNGLIVWNPSNNKTLPIPPLRETETYFDSSFFDVEVGLGYDPLAKDYKHVTLIFAKDYILQSVAIYTLGAGKWKIIPFQDKEGSKWRWVLESMDLKAVYVRGSLYFCVLTPDKSVLELVSIDLSSEVFSCTSLPNDAYNSSRNSKGFVTLVSSGSSLTVLDFDGKSAMWVLESSGTESESMCWTKPYKCDVRVPHFLYLKKNRDMLIWWGKGKKSFKLATGKKLLQQCGMVSSYNLETKKEEILVLQKRYRDAKFYGVFGYIESLVLFE